MGTIPPPPPQSLHWDGALALREMVVMMGGGGVNGVHWREGVLKGFVGKRVH